MLERVARNTSSGRGSLRTDTGWVVVGASAQALQQAVLMVAYSRWTTPQDVGLYALGLAVATPFNIFADRAVRTLLATSTRHEFPLADYLWLRAAIGIMSLLFSWAIIVAWGLNADAARILLLVGCIRLVEGLAQPLYGLMQQKRKMRLLGHAQSLRALVTALGAVMSLGIFRSMEASLLTTVVLSSLVLVTFECRSAEIQRERGKRSWIDQVWACGGLLVQAVPVGSAAFLVAISTSFPRLVISRTLGETVLGVFAVVCYLAFPATLVSSALMQAALPRLTHSVKDSPTLARKLLWKLFVVNAFLASVNGCLLVGPGPFLVSWLLESSDSLPDGLLGLLAVAVGISYLANVPATALVASRQFRLSLMSCGVSCFVAVCASLILIPVWGIRGAPVAMIFASFTHLMGTTASLHWSWQNDSCDRSEVRPVVTRRAA